MSRLILRATRLRPGPEPRGLLIRTGWLALLAVAPLAATQRSLAQEPLGLSAVQRPFQNADRATIQAGKRYAFVCPASDGVAGAVYGTDVYTADSAVCAAAIHAGALKSGQPGSVTVVMGSGAESFRGSSRNGVTTRGYGPWDRSYTFARDGAPGLITWRTVWSGIPDDFVTPITVECPATGSTEGKLWGTDVYTRDSVICVAGVHAGAITAQRGGPVVVTRVRHTGEFTASERNGVRSEPYGPFRDAFSVTTTRARVPVLQTSAVNDQAITPLTVQDVQLTQGAGASAIDPASAAAANAQRTIALAGFSAQGVVATPRTIPLSAFTATGTPPPSGTKTITVSGWTATGIRP
jgi:LCCL domain